MARTELGIFIGMSRTLNKINRTTSRIYNSYGLTTPQFGVLEALYHKGDLSIGEVQEKTLSSSGTIPVIVRNLEREGLLEKTRDEGDGRKFILHITDKGRDLMDRVYPENERAIISMMEVWTEEEKEELLACMKVFGGIEDEKRD